LFSSETYDIFFSRKTLIVIMLTRRISLASINSLYILILNMFSIFQLRQK